MVIASLQTFRPRPPHGPEVVSGQDLREVVSRLALRHRPPSGALRVVVGEGPEVAEAYLEARARVVGPLASDAGVGQPRVDPRFHVRLPLDPSGLPGPRTSDDADLVLVPEVRDGQVVSLVAAAGRALAAGGTLVLGLRRGDRRGIEASLAAADLRVRERVVLESGLEVIVAVDPRPRVELPEVLAGIDRSTCVDRERLLAAAQREPWRGPLRSDGGGERMVAELVGALEQQLEDGEVDVRTLPWPSLDVGADAEADASQAGCDDLVVMPHPDDESIYVGGTIAGLTAAGRRVRLLTVTDGAGGRGGDGLALRRRAELELAAEVLGIEAVRVLGWSDFGKYRDAAKSEPVTGADSLRAWGLRTALTELVAEIRRVRPRRLLGLDPEVDPNFSLHGHHLGLGILLAVAFHAAADGEFEPGAGAAWACDEHRVAAPASHGEWSETFEIDRGLAARALRAHATQSYSTVRLLEALQDPEHCSVEHTRVLQARRLLPWTLVKRSVGPAVDAGVDWEAEAERVRALPRPRAQLVELLREQAGAQLDAEQQHSLQVLAREGSVTIVTGQQVGLLGGPAYTLAKAVSAVALARRLQRQGIDAVPVFWLASQDHDLEEVQRVPRLSGSSLRLGLRSDGGPVGLRPLGSGIDALWQELVESLPPGVDPEMLERLRAWHRADQTFTSSFVGTLQQAMRGTGLLVLNPADPAFARLAGPLLRRAAHEAEAVDQALAAARQRLHAEGREETIATADFRERGVSQVFLVDDQGQRRRLPRTGHDLAALDAVLERAPQRLSGAALLRPVVQDFVLPTLAYVGGPTERRYLDQTTELHAWAGVPGPRVIDRTRLHFASFGDAKALAFAGGIDALRSDAAPLTTLARRALSPATRVWLRRLEQLIVRLRAPTLSAAALRDRLAGIMQPDPAALRDLPRLARHWPRRWEQVQGRADDVLHGPGQPGPRHAVARLRGELLRLHRSILRDARRTIPEAIDAWHRVGSEPAPPERRTTVVELLARSGPTLPGTILSALEAELSSELRLRIANQP
ncbi:MAG: bacillithiol biosynthesis BshC [Nannocystaceae bacterium]